MAKTYRKFTDVMALLDQRGTNKQASSTKAATAPTVPSVPEKDPNETGTVAIPGQAKFDGQPAKANVPESSKNSDETPVLAAPGAAKTVAGEEPAAINMKIANTVAAIRSFTKGVKAAMEDKALGTNVPSGAQSNVNTPKAPAPATAPKAEERKGDKGGKAAADTVKDVPEKDPTQKTAPEPKTPGPTDMPTGEAKNTDTAVGKEASAAAPAAPAAESDAAIEFTPEFHFKLASEILSTEDGRAYAQELIQRSLGAEQAENIIKAAAVMEEQAIAMAQYEASGEAEAQALWDSATPEQRQVIVKMASVHNLAKTDYREDFLKEAYDMGAGAASEDLDAEDAAKGADGNPPAGLDGNPPAPGADGASPASGASGGGDAGCDGCDGGDGGAGNDGEVSEEDILAVIQSLVQSGQLPPEEAEQILQQLFGGGDAGAPGAPGAPGGAGDAGAPGAPGGTGAGAPPEGASPEVKEAHAILAKSASVMAKLAPAAPAAPAATPK